MAGTAVVLMRSSVLNHEGKWGRPGGDGVPKGSTRLPHGLPCLQEHREGAGSARARRDDLAESTSGSSHGDEDEPPATEAPFTAEGREDTMAEGGVQVAAALANG